MQLNSYLLQLRHRAICNNFPLGHSSSTGGQVWQLLKSEDCVSMQLE